MEFKQLAESIDGIREVALFEAAKSKGDAYGEALNFFKTNTLPDGSKWGSSLTPMLGFDNDPKRTKEKKKDIKILQSLGASKSLTRRIFFFEGWMISIIGGATGLGIGTLVCWAQQKFEFLKI